MTFTLTLIHLASPIHRATRWRHKCLSWADASTSSQVNPILWTSFFTTSLQFILGLPGLLLNPATSQCSAGFGMRTSSILVAWHDMTWLIPKVFWYKRPLTTKDGGTRCWLRDWAPWFCDRMTFCISVGCKASVTISLDPSRGGATQPPPLPIYLSIFGIANEIAKPQLSINSNSSSIDCKQL